MISSTREQAVTGKIRVPRQSRAIQTRQQIVETAIGLFSRKGYFQTSSNEISKEAGAAIGSFYAYFKDKKQVFLAALEHYSDKVNALIDSALIPPDLPMEQGMQRFLQSLLDAHRIYPDFHQEVEAMAIFDSDVREVIHEQEKIELRRTHALLLSWKESLGVKDLELAALVIYNLVHENIHFIAFREPRRDPKPIITELVVMIHRYLFR